jgi:hypothetical protein
MANVNYPNSRIYSGHYFPVLIDFNFIVDAANGNGLGIRSLKGAYVKNVFMHTTAPLAGSGNPNPAAGNILIHLTDNFNRLLFATSGDIGPLSGSNLAAGASALTVGVAYVITVVGTTTTAEWVALGVPLGVTPAPGVSFIALLTGSGVGSGQVQLPSNSGIVKYQGVGDPNQSAAPVSATNNIAVQGSWLMFQALNASFAVTAPASGTVIGIQAYMSNSSLLLGGQ